MIETMQRLPLTPTAAAGAYARAQNQAGITGTDASQTDSSTSGDFGSVIEQALQGVVQTGDEAEAQAAKGLSGEGNLTQVVMAVSRAQLALQSTTAIRDKVVQAYQDIMKMSI